MRKRNRMAAAQGAAANADTADTAAAAAAAAGKHVGNRSIRITAKDASGEALFTRRTIAPLRIQEYRTLVRESLIASGYTMWPADDIRLVDNAGCDLMDCADVQAAIDDTANPLTEITATCRSRRPALTATPVEKASAAALEPVCRISKTATCPRNTAIDNTNGRPQLSLFLATASASNRGWPSARCDRRFAASGQKEQGQRSCSTSFKAQGEPCRHREKASRGGALFLSSNFYTFRISNLFRKRSVNVRLRSASSMRLLKMMTKTMT